MHQPIEELSNHGLLYWYEDAIIERKGSVVASIVPSPYSYQQVRAELFRRLSCEDVE